MNRSIAVCFAQQNKLRERYGLRADDDVMSVREAYGNLSVRPHADDQARLSGTRTITYSAAKHHILCSCALIRDLFGAGMRRMRECADHHLAAADGEVRDGDRHASGQDGDYASHAVTSRRWLSPLIHRLSVWARGCSSNHPCLSTQSTTMLKPKHGFVE